ncbi:transposase [Patescibacteria group bacterium]|nr:transposase [Patescibacteria group bacterium]
MSIRKVAFVPGEFYHIYNRGNSKQIIFHDKQDYNRFLALLYSVNTKQNIIFRLVFNDMYKFYRGERLVSIGGYCLMSNHFHLLLTETEDGSISKFMQKLTTAYSMYYNEKYKRTGGLFEGKFKSEHASEERYLKYLFSYIHLNPVKIIDKNWKTDGIKNKQKVLEFLKNYQYSSYKDYLGIDRAEDAILNRGDLPDYFSSKEEFSKEIFEWLFFNED